MSGHFSHKPFQPLLLLAAVHFIYRQIKVNMLFGHWYHCSALLCCIEYVTCRPLRMQAMILVSVCHAGGLRKNIWLDWYQVYSENYNGLENIIGVPIPPRWRGRGLIGFCQITLANCRLCLLTYSECIWYLSYRVDYLLNILCLQRFREIYETQVKRGPPSFKAEYDYAWCLVRSPSKADMQRGIGMLEGESSGSSVLLVFIVLCVYIEMDSRMDYSTSLIL